jgi:hypothetical protein
VKGREGPPGVFQGDALLHDGVSRDVGGVVIINKTGMFKALKGTDSENKQTRTNKHIAGGFADFHG